MKKIFLSALLCLNFVANANPCDCADFDPGQCGAENSSIAECQGGNTCEECNQAIVKAIQANASVPIDSNLWILIAIGAGMALYYHKK